MRVLNYFKILIKLEKKLPHILKNKFSSSHINTLFHAFYFKLKESVKLLKSSEEREKNKGKLMLKLCKRNGFSKLSFENDFYVYVSAKHLKYDYSFR